MASKTSSSGDGATMAPLMARLFRISLWTAVAAGVLLLLDLVLGLRLPQPVRPALPIVVAAGMCVALVLGVGFHGAPKREDHVKNDSPGPS